MVLDCSNERNFKSPLDDYLDMKKSSRVCALVCVIQDICILGTFFQEECFKFSLNGSDLAMHDAWLSYLCEYQPELLKDVKSIILEIPYYSFDWDMQSSRQVYFRMVQFDRVDKYDTFKRNKTF